VSKTKKKVKEEQKKKSTPALRILKKDVLSEGFIHLSRVTAEVTGRDGRPLKLTREVHHHGNVAAILPVDRKRHTALLVRQWRIPLWLNGYKEPLLEATAGIIDDGETPEACAMREVIEETGYAVSNVRNIAEVYTSPGTLTERLYLYLADYDESSKRNDGGGLRSEGEDIEVVELGIPALKDMAARGEILDAKTLILIHAL